METNNVRLTAQTTGRRGEDAASSYLETKGWRILARRFRIRGGEIDLVAEEDGVVVFVEVKTRAAGSLDDGRGAVDHRKKKSLARAAALFLARMGLSDRPCRFDVLTVTPAGEGHRFRHHRAAFELGS